MVIDIVADIVLSIDVQVKEEDQVGFSPSPASMNGNLVTMQTHPNSISKANIT